MASAVRDLTHGRGPDGVIEVSGSSRALNEAIRTAAYEGNITVLSWYQGEAKGLYLSEEFHHNRLKIRCSHTTGTDIAFSNTWDMARRTETCKELMQRLHWEHMIST